MSYWFKWWNGTELGLVMKWTWTNVRNLAFDIDSKNMPEKITIFINSDRTPTFSIVDTIQTFEKQIWTWFLVDKISRIQFSSLKWKFCAIPIFILTSVSFGSWWWFSYFYARAFSCRYMVHRNYSHIYPIFEVKKLFPLSSLTCDRIQLWRFLILIYQLVKSLVKIGFDSGCYHLRWRNCIYGTC